jgi:hydrogenase nickel incorporation protein HypB
VRAGRPGAKIQRAVRNGTGMRVSVFLPGRRGVVMHPVIQPRAGLLLPPALQINTGKGCHLDAHMVGAAVHRLGLQADSLLLIENVGNLVCPAGFDLGEAHKVVIFSVTEGEDKPLKYPDMFRAADLMLLNKCDLLPYLDFDAGLAVENARRVNPHIKVLRVSATSNEGMGEWLQWIKDGCSKSVAAKPPAFAD